MSVCSRVNFQIPKYFEMENSRSKLGFPVRYCMLQDILVTCLLVISKEVQLWFWEWLCVQQWIQCVVAVAMPCVPCLDSHCSGWQCQGKNDKNNPASFFSAPPCWCKRSCYNNKSKLVSGILSRGCITCWGIIFLCLWCLCMIPMIFKSIFFPIEIIQCKWQAIWVQP